MNPETPDLEDVLMRWHAGELTLQEEESLANRLMNDPSARRALVFSFMLTGEIERRLGLAKKKQEATTPARDRVNFAWLAAGLGVAAAACVVMFYGFGMPGRTPPPVMPAFSGGHELDNPRGGENAEQEKRIAALIAQLADDDANKRDEAEKELRTFGLAAMAQLEKASADNDAERSARAKRLVRGLQIGELLKGTDAGLLAAKAFHADTVMANGPYQTWKGAISQSEPGKYDWKMELVPADGVVMPNKQSRTVICDGETIWANLTYTSQGRAPTTIVYKAAYAKQEKAVTHKMFSVSLPPTEYIKLVREKVTFTNLKSSTLNGKNVWVLEGATNGEGITMGGPASGANGGTSIRGNGAKLARLIVERDGSGTFAAEVLGDAEKPIWRVELSNAVLGSGKDGATYTYQPPEGARIIDMDAQRQREAGPNQLQVGGGNAAGVGGGAEGKDPNANPKKK